MKLRKNKQHIEIIIEYLAKKQLISSQ